MKKKDEKKQKRKVRGWGNSCVKRKDEEKPRENKRKKWTNEKGKNVETKRRELTQRMNRKWGNGMKS